MRKNLIKILLLCFISIITSCEAALMPEPQVTPTSVFNDLWHQLDIRYPHFETKNVDWDLVHEKYSNLIFDSMSSTDLFTVLRKMLNELPDGHVNLMSSFNVSQSVDINRAILGMKNYNDDVIYKNYLTYQYNTTGGIAHKDLYNGRIAYLRYGSFSNNISISNLNYIYSLYKFADGLILDLRSNTGGLVENLRTFLKVLPNNGQVLYYTQEKTGPGHEDFGEKIPSFAPKNDKKAILWEKPIVVLIGPRSYSCSSIAALCLKNYDNVVVMGSPTSGGTSVVYTFELQCGWQYRTPMARTFSVNGENYENGVPPDIEVALSPTLDLLGVDSIIEEACDYIFQKSIPHIIP